MERDGGLQKGMLIVGSRAVLRCRDEGDTLRTEGRDHDIARLGHHCPPPVRARGADRTHPLCAIFYNFAPGEAAPAARQPVLGSWAARASGEAGPAPADMDLLVIGQPDRDDLHDAVGRARARLGRDINTLALSIDRWNADDDPFLTEVRLS
jgi:hypothetical protein